MSSLTGDQPQTGQTRDEVVAFLRPTASGASAVRAPLFDLRVAVSALVDAASHMRTKWAAISVAELEAALLGLEHDLVSVQAKVVRISEGVLASGDRDRASTARGARLERDLAYLDRASATRDRDAAALSWHLAAQLRQAASIDRDRAALLRHQAALERAASTTDDVTGALERGHGLAALEREVERCRRGDGRIVVGFVDVDGLKHVNDTQGHPAGDQLLRDVVVALKASLRSYDVVVRYGGDEFVYSMAGVSRQAAMARFRKMAVALAEATGGQTVSVGFAELGPSDTLPNVIARADADLYARRQRRPPPS
jgi:diguanylate cyclase (GGDEF)-like protein